MISVCESFGHNDFLHAQRYRMIAQAGFDAVLLMHGDDHGEQMRAQNRPAMAREAGLFVENIHTHFWPAHLLWKDSPEGQRQFAGYLQCVEDCAAYEIPTMVVHPAQLIPVTVNDLGRERFHTLARRAEELGVNVAIENLITPPVVALAKLLLEEIDSPRVGFCYDSGHDSVCPSDMLRRFGHRLMALHLHDNHGLILGRNGDLQGTSDDDQHMLPFDGNIDWPVIMGGIAATGYQGPTAMEIGKRGRETLPPEELLALAYERAKRLESIRNS